MPTNLTEVAQFTANVPVADDGEDADAASIIQSFQPLADRTQFLRAGLPEYAIVGRRLVYAPGDGTVRVGPIGGVVLGGKLLSKGTETNLGSSGRVSNTWHYVYCYDSAGTLTVEESTTAPVDSLALKNGDATRAYLGCFVTDGSGVPVPMRYSDGECLYRFSAATLVKFTAAAAGAVPGSWTDVSLAALVPPHARKADLHIRYYGTSAPGATSLDLRTKGDTAATRSFVTNGENMFLAVGLETNSSQAIQWQGSNATAGLYLEGFRE
jgi:hypothetical protein